MNTKFILFLYGLSLSYLAQGENPIVLEKRYQTPKTIFQVQTMIKRTYKRDIENLLRNFVSCCKPNRYMGTKGHHQAVKYLLSKINEHDSAHSGLVRVDPFVPDIKKGVQFYQNDFDQQIKPTYRPGHPEYLKWNRYIKSAQNALNSLKQTKGQNIIWEKRGTSHPEQVLVIGAHYDNIVFDKQTQLLQDKAHSRGANNNASGVTIALKLIEYLSQVNIKKSVQVIFFDFEMLGFLGSARAANVLQAELSKGQFKKIIGMINLEMLGHDTKSLDKEKKYGNMKMYIRKPASNGSLLDETLGRLLIEVGSRMTKSVQFPVLNNGFNGSAHIRFWEKNIPAVVFTQNWETDFNDSTFHSENDVPEAINFKTLTSAFHFIGGSIIALLMDLPY